MKRFIRANTPACLLLETAVKNVAHEGSASMPP
jgi:hypothetical protein